MKGVNASWWDYYRFHFASIPFSMFSISTCQGICTCGLFVVISSSNLFPTSDFSTPVTVQYEGQPSFCSHNWQLLWGENEKRKCVQYYCMFVVARLEWVVDCLYRYTGRQACRWKNCHQHYMYRALSGYHAAKKIVVPIILRSIKVCLWTNHYMKNQ